MQARFPNLAGLARDGVDNSDENTAPRYAKPDIHLASEPFDQSCHPPSNWRDVCTLLNVSSTATASDALVFQHVLIKAGRRVYGIGERFEMLYLVNAGFLKTIATTDGGHEAVLRFPMKGDMLGADGIHAQRHPSETVALSDCDLILLPFRRLAALGRQCEELGDIIYKAISRDLVFGQVQIGMFSTLCAEARLARFLTMQADRYAQLGYSSKSFNLQMTRRDIGSYLGLSLETVSRAFSALCALGMINVSHRMVEVNDAVGLKTLRRLPPSFLNARMRNGRSFTDSECASVLPGTGNAKYCAAPAGDATSSVMDTLRVGRGLDAVGR